MDALRSFRRNVVHVRQALTQLRLESGKAGVERGYSEDARLMERYKRLSIPVRRALNPGDRASLVQAMALLTGPESTAAPAALAAATDAWRAYQQESDSLVGLGGSKVPRGQILQAWLDAAAFYDTLDRDRAYDRLINEWGTAAEGIGAQLVEQAADVIVLFDTAAASALGEPEILPPPPKTPPPPPDPEEVWWRRWLKI